MADCDCTCNCGGRDRCCEGCDTDCDCRCPTWSCPNCCTDCSDCLWLNCSCFCPAAYRRRMNRRQKQLSRGYVINGVIYDSNLMPLPTPRYSAMGSPPPQRCGVGSIGDTPRTMVAEVAQPPYPIPSAAQLYQQQLHSSGSYDSLL